MFKLSSVVVASLSLGANAFAPSTSGGVRAPTVLRAEIPVIDEEVIPVIDEDSPASPPLLYSRALPGQPRPAGLNSIALAGDRGFDPLNLAKDKETLLQFRAAEIKHARLAMLAAAGWPLAEVWDKSLANLIGADSPIADNGGLSPSLLNGGLDKIAPAYWAFVVLAAAAVEGLGFVMKSETPGDYGFDPVGLYPKDAEGQMLMQDKELIHGRVAMVAIVAFAAQEFVSKVPVVRETPFFFEPIWTFATKELHLFDLSNGFISY